MTIKRVLTIESYDDRTIRDLLRTIYGSQEFKDYIIKHCFFLRDEQKFISSQQLYHCLKKNINKFEPEAILIHAGGSFFNNENAFIKALSKITKRYPNILFGVQRRNRQKKAIISMLDNNEEILELEKLFFAINR